MEEGTNAADVVVVVTRVVVFVVVVWMTETTVVTVVVGSTEAVATETLVESPVAIFEHALEMRDAGHAEMGEGVASARLLKGARGRVTVAATEVTVAVKEATDVVNVVVVKVTVLAAGVVVNWTTVTGGSYSMKEEQKAPPSASKYWRAACSEDLTCRPVHTWPRREGDGLTAFFR